METRRNFLSKTTAGVAIVGLAAVGSVSAESKADDIKMVGACGLSCQVCPLMKAGKCGGCGPGTSEMAGKKECPVIKCAAMKKIDYCGTGCPGYTKCAKLIGKPYAQEFMDGIKKRLG